MTADTLEQVENLRRASERGLRLAQKEMHSNFIDAFQHLLDDIARLKKGLHG